MEDGWNEKRANSPRICTFGTTTPSINPEIVSLDPKIRPYSPERMVVERKCSAWATSW